MWGTSLGVVGQGVFRVSPDNTRHYHCEHSAEMDGKTLLLKTSYTLYRGNGEIKLEMSHTLLTG